MRLFLGITSLLVVACYPIVIAAAVAIILNLPYSGGMRFLIFVGGWGIYAMLSNLVSIKRHAEKQERWAHLTFIALQIRNEADRLEGPWERFKSDLEEDSTVRWQGSFGLLGFVAFFVVLAVMLNLGLFGETGAGWFEHFKKVVLSPAT